MALRTLLFHGPECASKLKPIFHPSSKVLLCVCPVRPPPTALVRRRPLPSTTADRCQKVLSQYPVTESRRLPLSLPLFDVVYHRQIVILHRKPIVLFIGSSPTYSNSQIWWKVLQLTNARDVFANNVQRLFDSTQKIVSLQQTNHDMVSHRAKAKAAVEELKGLLVCNSVEETTKRIDKLLMVLILRSLHPNYEHVRD
ncbi:hypothetical protein CR513_07362, partial [Mucuna pruriens]